MQRINMYLFIIIERLGEKSLSKRFSDLFSAQSHKI